MDALIRGIASFGGTGHFPFAPATFASLVFGGLLYLAPTLSPLAWVIAIVVCAILGVWVSTRAEAFWGHDASPIVIDEVLGMLVTLVLIPKIWWVWVAGFFLFRFFDIAKPFPAGRAQSLPGGWGVMTDDLVAGIYAHLVLRAILWVWG